MRIVADENIAQVREYFAHAGEVLTLPGRGIGPAQVRDADVLLVRSVTRVDAALLSGSRCRFVGTATSGVDHVDTAWLRQQGIAFGSARGCNANAVAEYVLCALAWLSAAHGFDWRHRSVGIVGCGEVGSRLARKLLALGMPVAIHDPFLDGSHPLAGYFAGLDTVLAQSVVTLHTPLTRDTAWPTRHLFDAALLGRMAPDSILVNAARGAVVDNAALEHLLVREPRRLAVVDAWEQEPAIAPGLLARVALGTAHIAGYSVEGKLEGTRMVAAAFAEFSGSGMPPGGGADAAQDARWLEVDPASTPLAQANRLLLSAYDIGHDHRSLQGLLTAQQPDLFFDSLRREYPLRHEFARFRLHASSLHPEVAALAVALGFNVTV